MSKPTLLEKYQLTYADLTKRESPLPLEAVRTFQELLYRTEVLQVCQMFTVTAPVGNDLGAMLKHYQMVDGYFESIKSERRIGPAASEEVQSRRDTAHQNLCRIVADYRKRFGSFKPGDPEQYKNEIGNVISTFLPAWIQMRNTLIHISTKEGAAT